MLSLQHIVKTYDNALLLQGISLTIADGEIVCLLGPSGSGKTTLLRIIAGLEPADSGDIFCDGQNMWRVPTHQRNFGMMFQDLALFPHQNVFDNIAFGLRMQNAARAEIVTRVAETLELVGLTGFEKRNVNQLSGGEQQRVALARALAPRPRLLMLDEPLGALDRILREQLVDDVRAILKRSGMTALYVTHDQDEAFAIADRIAIIHGGRVVQIGAPAEIYRAPANAFVARFLGLPNLFPARLRSDARAETELGTFIIEGTLGLALQQPRATLAPTSAGVTNAVALIRPNRIRIAETGNGIRARVTECTYRRERYRARVVTEQGAELIVETERPLTRDAVVGIEIDSVEIIDA